jgi:hypothetical protein
MQKKLATQNPKLQHPKPAYIKLNVGGNVGNFVPAKTPGETSPSGCTRYGYRLRAYQSKRLERDMRGANNYLILGIICIRGEKKT